MRRSLRSAILPLLLLLAARSAGADEPPKPDFDRVDHRKPQEALAVEAAWGDPRPLASLAKQLKRATPHETLAAIGRWIDRNLRYDSQAAYAWRTTDAMRKDGTYGGCADHAVLYGLLVRSAGIPTVWVKTMDVDWIVAFRAGRPEAKRYAGHVFLEVHLGDRWALLDASQGLLYEDYDPATRILPGNRYAYDKGADPYALVLSCRWEEWKRQTDAFFSALDLSKVPWSRPKDLGQRWNVWIAGDAPRYEWATSIVRDLGLRPKASFNEAFDVHLKAARGGVLVVTVSGAQPVLPEAARREWLPEGWEGLAASGRAGDREWLLRRLPDGTRVVLVASQSREGMEVALAEALRE